MPCPWTGGLPSEPPPHCLHLTLLWSPEPSTEDTAGRYGKISHSCGQVTEPHPHPARPSISQAQASHQAQRPHLRTCPGSQILYTLLLGPGTHQMTRGGCSSSAMRPSLLFAHRVVGFHPTMQTLLWGCLPTSSSVFYFIQEVYKYILVLGPFDHTSR